MFGNVGERGGDSITCISVSALCLLDLTAVFDIVDHELLLLRLERQFGLRAWHHACVVAVVAV